MKKIAIIGAGGINSSAIEFLHDMTKNFNQTIYVKIFDNDIVEEKNLVRGNQNFKVEDLMLEKAETLGKRYEFDYDCTFINKDNIDLLSQFDDILVGVDNHKVRQMLYEYALTNNKYLLDLRAQGTQFGFYVLDHTKNMEYYNKKHFSNEKVMDRKGSCQSVNDIENDHIENANKAIAFIGIYCIYLKHLRGETLSANEFKYIY